MNDTPALRVANWDKWQSYRRDRGQPPWIKVHRQLLRNIEWVNLTDAQRGQLVAIWLLAADHDGVIPASAGLLQKLCFMSEEPDLKLFIKQGFLEGRLPDAKVTPKRGQHVTPEAEEKEMQSRQRQTDAKMASERRQGDAGVGNGHDNDPVEQVFAHWKEVHEHPKAVLTPKRRKLIRAALKDYSLADVLRSIGGYRLSPYHMGDNDRSTVYDSIELFLRDAKHIEAGLSFRPVSDGSLAEHRESINRLAELMGVDRGAKEPWDVFEERVSTANRRRIAILEPMGKATGNA